jgi:hypothetical protein
MSPSVCVESSRFSAGQEAAPQLSASVLLLWPVTLSSTDFTRLPLLPVAVPVLVQALVLACFLLATLWP